MKHVLAMVLLLNCGLAFAGDFSGIDLKQINLSEIKAVELPGAPLVNEKADKVKQLKGKYTYIWMSVRQNLSWKEAEAYDYSNRIETRVRKIFDNRFDVTMNVDIHYEWSSIDKIFDRDYQMFSAGINLRMNEWGSNYNISGNITDANNQYKYINLNMFKRFDDFSYSINGFGIYLNIDKYNINGNFDEKEYSKKAIAAIVSMALALQIEKTPAEPAQTSSSGQTNQDKKAVSLVPENKGMACAAWEVITALKAVLDAAGRIAGYIEVSKYVCKAWETVVVVEDNPNYGGVIASNETEQQRH